MEPKYLGVLEVIIHPNHHLTRRLDPEGRVSPFQKQSNPCSPRKGNQPLFASRGPFSSDEGAAVLAFCATGQIRSGRYGKFRGGAVEVEVAVPSKYHVDIVWLRKNHRSVMYDVRIMYAS